MNPKPINQLATWLPMNKEGLLIKVYVTEYPYLSNGIILRATVETPVVRYAKNYQLGLKNYSLCIITTEKDTKKIEKWLDKKSKDIKPHMIAGGFKLLDFYYE